MLSTSDSTLITEVELSDSTLNGRRRRQASRHGFLSWAGVGIAIAAVAGLGVAVLRPDAASPAHDNARTVARYGSIAAIDHRDQQAALNRAMTHTVAEHGSIAAIDHADQHQ